MEIIAISLSMASVLAIIVAGLLMRSFLPTYFVEKGKNLASKEDLAHLTELVEKVKAHHASEIERLKADLSKEGQVMERRRKIYDDICTGLRIFIAGHGDTLETQQQFYASYSAAWLWSSDAVLNALNHFVALQVQRAANPAAIREAELKSAYTTIVAAMRRDVGFVETTVDQANYQFIVFGPPEKNRPV